MLAVSEETLFTSGRISGRPEWTVRNAPAVKWLLPPAHEAGHLSISKTRFAPDWAAEIAEQKPAFPPPTTRTSQVMLDEAFGSTMIAKS